MLLILVIILGCFVEIQCSDQENQQYQQIKINNLYEIHQNQTAKTIKLNLTLDNFFIQNYIVIDVIIVSDLEQNSKFVACLNFDEDPLLKQDYLSQGSYTCHQIDSFSTEKKRQQHLIVISIDDPLYKSNKYPFLTFFYKQSQEQNTNPSEITKKVLQYDIFAYNFNQYPCHSNCNGKNGICNGKDGTCTCKQNYMDGDCGIYIQPLNLINEHDSNNLMIQSLKVYYFKIQMKILLLNAQKNHINFSLKKFNTNSIIDVKVFVNEKGLPSEQDSEIQYRMENDDLAIKNLEDLCKQFPLDLNNTSPSSQQGNSTQFQGIQDDYEDCFTILAVRQIKKTESTVLQISVLFSSEEQKNKDSQQEQVNQQSSKEEEKSLKHAKSNQIVAIALAIIISVVIFAICSIKIIFKIMSHKQKNKSSEIRKRIPQVITQNLLAPKKSQSKIIEEFNNKLKVEQRKKLILSKKRLLQLYLMPNQQYSTSPSLETQDMNNQNLNQDKQKQQQDNFDVSIELQIRKQYQNIENGDESIIISPKSKDKDQILPPKGKKSDDKEVQEQIQQNDENKNLESQISTDKKQQEQYIPTTLQVSTHRSKLCCPLCFVELLKGAQVRVTICSHCFHSECLEQWLKKNDNCPLCRQSFEIMDMIDYISLQLYSRVSSKQSKHTITAQRNYVNSRLQQEQEHISQLQNKDFLNIFKEYIPDYENQIQKVDIDSLHITDKKSSKRQKLQNKLIKRSLDESIDSQTEKENQDNEKSQEEDDEQNDQRETQDQKEVNQFSHLNEIFSKQRPSLNNNRFHQYSALVKSSIQIQLKQKKQSSSFDLIPSANNLSDNNKTKDKLSFYNFSQLKLNQKNNLTEDQLKDNPDNTNHTRMTSQGLESQPNYLIKQSNNLLRNGNPSFQASPINSEFVSLQGFSKQPSFYDIKADSYYPNLNDEDSHNSLQKQIQNLSYIQAQEGYKFVDEINEPPSDTFKQPSSMNKIDNKLKQNCSKMTTSLKQIEFQKNNQQLNFIKKPNNNTNVS